MDQSVEAAPPEERVPDEQHGRDDDQRVTLWRTAWGVVLAASGAFSLGYAMSRAADPSVGASRPPVWPLVVSLFVVVVSLWFVLAPTLHRWPFQEREAPPGEIDVPWLVELTDADEADQPPR